MFIAQVKKVPGVFYGWWVVFGSFIGLSTSPGPFAFASLGLFMIPLGTEFGWDRAEISVAFTVLTFFTAVSSPIIGRCADRLGVRPILLFSLGCLGIGMLALTLMSELWHLLAIYAFIGVFAAGSNSLPYMRSLALWFDKNRGLAMGLAMAGIGLGYAYVPQLVNYALNNYGWREAYMALGVAVFGVGLPIVYFFLKESPASMGLTIDGGEKSESGKAAESYGLSSGEAYRTKKFLLLFFVFMALSFVLNGVLTHIVPMLRDRGMSSDSALLVASTVGVTMVGARVLIGYLVDRLFAPYVAAFFFFLSALGIIMLGNGVTGTMAYIAAVALGFSLGAEMDMMAYLISRYFGVRAFGEIYGVLFAAILIGTAIGPLAFGHSYEVLGSYKTILWLAAGVNILTMVLICLLGKYPTFTEKKAAA